MSAGKRTQQRRKLLFALFSSLVLVTLASSRRATVVVVAGDVNLCKNPLISQLSVPLLKPPDELNFISIESTNDSVQVGSLENQGGSVWICAVRLMSDEEIEGSASKAAAAIEKLEGMAVQTPGYGIAIEAWSGGIGGSTNRQGLAETEIGRGADFGTCPAGLPAPLACMGRPSM